MKESEGWQRMAEWIDEQPEATVYFCNVLKYPWKTRTMGIPDDVAAHMMVRLAADIRDSNVGTIAQGSSNPFYWFETNDGAEYGPRHNQQRLLYCLFMVEQTKRLK